MKRKAEVSLCSGEWWWEWPLPGSAQLPLDGDNGGGRSQWIFSKLAVGSVWFPESGTQNQKVAKVPTKP